MENALILKGIKKYFPGTKALDWDSDQIVEFKAGEIHGLVGENGAGKSTLFQILMGIHDMTEGEMTLFEKPYRPSSSREAEEAGVAIIMQQPNFAFNLTVAENIFLGRDKTFLNKAGGIDWKRQNAAAAEILHEYHYDHIKPTDIVGSLKFEERKQVEIARALSVRAKVLLVDETSAAISKESVEGLYALLREQKEQGVCVIYISHFIDEVYSLCDRLTVLRDGKLITRMNVCETTPQMIINSMVGRNISAENYRSEDSSSIGEVMVELKNFTMEGEFENINLTVRAGEIVGIAGIGGCGSEALGRALFGYERATGGELIYKGTSGRMKSPLEAIRSHIGYIPKDRDTEGLFLIYDSVWNISSANLTAMSRAGMIDHKKERETARKAVREFRIKTPSELTNVSSLSGGNRQKVVIAKWIENHSEFLIVCSPTRGVDVGAKYEIYHFLERLKNEGKSILLISDELPELIGMCDRIYTFKSGKNSGEFTRGKDFSEELIMAKMV